jgi:hypothetical protein
VIAYLDCSTGVSGDKLLGALVDAGFDLTVLRTALSALGLRDVAVDAERRVSGGIAAVGISVTEPGAPVRGWREIRALLDGAPVPVAAREGALEALTALAEAEARVHGVPVDEVHFHEIGAADTIVDVLGVALALDDLGINALHASPVAVGSGTVRTAHGELPVPAPATSLLLEGVPVVPGPSVTDGGPIGELTTPTGAALLATFVAEYGPVPPMTLRRIGTGCGTRELGTPNVCQLLVGEPATDEPGHDGVVVLEANLDHLTPEELAVAAERLRQAGSLDVWQTPIVMKKGRAAFVLSVLVREVDLPHLADRMIAETGTLGVRVIPSARRVVERDVAEATTSLGTARFKVAYLPDGQRVLRVESDDAARIAAERGLGVDETARILEADAAKATGVQPMRQRPSAEETNPSD